MATILDTNILLRMIDLKDPMNQDVTKAIKVLRRSLVQHYNSPNRGNLGEFRGDNRR